MKRLLLILFLSCISYSWGQFEYPTDNVIIDDFAYPDFGDGSFYGDFMILYPLGESTFLGVRGALQQNIIFNRFNLELMVQQRIVRKLYLRTGMEIELDLNQSILGQTPSASTFFGLEYKPKPNISIHSGLRIFLNRPSFNPLGTERSDARSQWENGIKIKF